MTNKGKGSKEKAGRYIAVIFWNDLTMTIFSNLKLLFKVTWKVPSVLRGALVLGRVGFRMVANGYGKGNNKNWNNFGIWVAFSRWCAHEKDLECKVFPLELNWKKSLSNPHTTFAIGGTEPRHISGRSQGSGKIGSLGSNWPPCTTSPFGLNLALQHTTTK